jgi:hypothetical protein
MTTTIPAASRGVGYEAARTLRVDGPRRIRPGRRREILESIRWMHRAHVRDLGRLGYSAKEAFWLDFACLPFLPWDPRAGGEMPLSWVLGLYADLYRRAFGSFGSREERPFVELLRQRYHRMRQLVAAASAAAPEAATGGVPGGKDTGPVGGAQDWASLQGGLIVLQTARAWQMHHASFPCRLVEDL